MKDESSLKIAVSTMMMLGERFAKNNIAHGFYPHDAAQNELWIANQFAMIAGEAHEAHEQIRKGMPPFYIEPATGKPEGAAVEAVDIIIRTLGLVCYLGYDMVQAFVSKVEYNENKRPHLHGKLF